ncbi:hypothetical protein D3C81_1196680 [compost metagenome]
MFVRLRQAIEFSFVQTRRFDELEGHAGLLAHHLQRLLQPFPDEPRAQDVMAIDRRLPGLLETLRIKAVDIHTHLVDVVATGLFVQRVEQHALLHRRQRVQVVDLPRRYG